MAHSASNITFAGVSLNEAVKRLLDLKDAHVSAQIDAGFCGTDADYRRAHKRASELYAALDEFERAFDVNIVGKDRST